MIWFLVGGFTGRMVVNSVKFKPSSPSTSLYPDLSLIADDNQDKETPLTPSEIQSMACKVVLLFFVFIKCIFIISVINVYRDAAMEAAL